MQKQVYFVSGIDTGIGKSIATGLYAKELADAGRRVTTQKIVQTGCQGIAEDIQRQHLPLCVCLSLLAALGCRAGTAPH